MWPRSDLSFAKAVAHRPLSHSAAPERRTMHDGVLNVLLIKAQACFLNMQLGDE